MQVIIEDKKYSLSTPFNSGGEGEVYELADDPKNLRAVKIYHPDILSEERRQKVESLCNAYANNVDKFGGNNFAFPSQPAYKNKFFQHGELVGFAMSLFADCPHVNDLNYDINVSSFREVNGNSFDEKTCIKFIYQLFELADELHDSRIVLGDVNPGNVLCQWTANGPQPVLIDLDAVQFGTFNCTEFYKEEYLDPDLERNGKNISSRYIYSSSSDVFSLAVLCYYLWVGFYPYAVRTRPATPQNIAKLDNFSVLRYLCEGSGFLINKEYIDASNTVHRSRLIDLRKHDNLLYDFFVSVLVKGQRKSLTTFLQRKDIKNPYINEVIQRTGLGKVLEALKSARKPLYVIPKDKIPKPQIVTRTQIKDFDPDEFSKFLIGYGIANPLESNRF